MIYKDSIYEMYLIIVGQYWVSIILFIFLYNIEQKKYKDDQL